MKLLKFCKFMIFITLLSLIYIHLQMKIINLAYQGKNKEEKIRSLIEENGNVTYTILTLKSANNLGIKMLDENSDMAFVDPNNIVKIATPRDFFIEASLNEVSNKNKNKNKKTLLSLLSLGSTAEAKIKE